MPLLALPFPAIDPIAVEFGPFAIRWYALAYVAGLIFAWWYMLRMASTARLWGVHGTAPVSRADVDDVIVWSTLGVILGGRIGYVLFYNLPFYLDHPLQALRLWEGGMSFHGGFAGVCLAIILFARRRGVPVSALGDMAAAATPVGLFLGRLANFVNGELWGRPTDVPWAFVFPYAGPQARHPSQLYEAALEGIVLFCLLAILVWGYRALSRPWLVTGAFAAGYAVARIIVEFFREPDAQIGFLAGGATMGMVLSVPMLLVGLALMAFALSRPPRPARETPEVAAT